MVPLPSNTDADMGKHRCLYERRRSVTAVARRRSLFVQNSSTPQASCFPIIIVFGVSCQSVATSCYCFKAHFALIVSRRRAHAHSNSFIRGAVSLEIVRWSMPPQKMPGHL